MVELNTSQIERAIKVTGTFRVGQVGVGVGVGVGVRVGVGDDDDDDDESI